LKITEYDIIGFSDGGITALLLGMKDERLKHIVTIGANTKPNMLKLIYRLGMVVELICLVPFCIYNKKARRTLKLTQLMLTQPHIEYADLNKITVPTLVLAGEFDMIKREDTEAIANSIQYSIMKIIEQGNHCLLSDSFEKTLEEITRFLQACHQED
ncbi:MAG: alpha/beta hydrolase, partial [Coprobacillus sp.]